MTAVILIVLGFIQVAVGSLLWLKDHRLVLTNEHTSVTTYYKDPKGNVIGVVNGAQLTELIGWHFEMVKNEKK